MNLLKNITCLAGLIIALASCKKDHLDVQQTVGLGGDTTASTPIDKWIQDSLTSPYNIAVKYRWDPANASLFTVLTPVDESRIIPLFSALQRVWINPYNDETGSNVFMKKYTPKQFVLLGSVEYQFSTVLLGQAEGGNNIVFYDVNQNYDKNPVTSIKRVIHTAHHEFGHILHQNIMYPQDFKGTASRLGLQGYSAATWFNISEEDALANGYATSYSMSGPDDDFVEMIAVMLTEGKSRWEEIKASTNTVARQALQQKEDYVVTYYRQSWNIDFYRLQTRVQAALNALYPTPSILDAFAFEKTYNAASIDMAKTTLLPQSAGFTNVYNAAKASLSAQVSGGTSGRVLDSIWILHNASVSVIVICWFHPAGAPGSPAAASFFFNHTQDANNVFTFYLDGYNQNGFNLATGFAPLVNYFSNNKFLLSWYADPSISIYPRVRFTPQSAPANFFTASLFEY